MRRAWVLILLSAAVPAQDSEEAENLLQAVQDRMQQAKTLRVEYTATVGDEAEWKCVAKAKGINRWVYRVSVVRGDPDAENNTGSLVSDGRKVLGTGMENPRHHKLDRPEMGAELRRSLALSCILLTTIEGKGRDSLPAQIASVKNLSKEKLEGREVRVLEYVLKYESGLLRGDDIRVKLFLDSAEPIPIKRETYAPGGTWTEVVNAFAIDEEIPDSEFSLQSNRKLAEARTRQLARSVELFGRFTGYHPCSLDDLLSRPKWLEPEIFWPDGGFVLGSALPKDPWGRTFELRTEMGRVRIVSPGDGREISCEVPAVTRRPTGAPAERLQKQFTARVQIHLLVAAVRGFFDAYGEWPRKKAALWERPDWVEFWPEGSWLPGGLPSDPWGEPYRIISDLEFVRVQVKDPRVRAIAASEMTAELRRQLEEISRPRFSKEEFANFDDLFERLRDENLMTREQAEEELRSWGPALVPILEERLKKETDPEALSRLNRLSQAIPRPGVWWAQQLALLSMTAGSSDLAENERAAVSALKTIATAQADFRSCDRDNNNQRDFWTGDIAGLYAIDNTSTGAAAATRVKLIELPIALADQNATSGTLTNGNYSRPISTFGVRQAKDGYWFRVLGDDLQTTALGGKGTYAQDTDGTGDPVHNISKFGICAIPESYGVTGTKVFILNENNTIFWRDFGADVLNSGTIPPSLSGVWTPDWPTDATLTASWNKLD